MTDHGWWQSIAEALALPYCLLVLWAMVDGVRQSVRPKRQPWEDRWRDE